ncbi:MAG: GerMN domain-containing protein [Bacteroides sp.]|nr:GerMN domain-containing protein [Bacteroides sp.]MCM1550982.1 GerMN domain-containing protein [Clostridium sp.]
MKKWMSICLLISLMLGLFGCSDAGSQGTATTEVDLPENAIYLYYIDSATYELAYVPYELDETVSENKGIESILNTMFTEAPDNQTNLISASMRLLRSAYQKDTSLARVVVNVANELNDQYVEVLAKAAITKTLCQLDYVENVQFEIYDSSTISDEQSVIETYDSISFVDAEQEGGFLQTGVITLYFANESGDMLLEYDKAVEISNNVSLEQLVIESLITGPLREGYYPTIPEGTTLKKVSIKDGVCYVDLSVEFNNTLNTCMDTTTIYSVVNSLCELPTINRVQFLINGEKQELYRTTIPFDGMFEWQPDLIQEQEPAQSKNK